MKKLKTQYTIILIMAAYFLLNGFIPRQNKIVVQYGVFEFHSWQMYSNMLESEGYTKLAAHKIALVEFGVLPVDEDYTGLKED